MTDAEKREKVTRGLKCCMLSGDCNLCPYTETRCQEHLCGDAFALLKEQEARVMNVKEVRESVGNPMWFESCGKYLGEKGWWCLSLGGDPSFHIRISTSKANGPITLSLTDYNKVWRCWTAKPFPEQMQETPWEEMRK